MESISDLIWEPEDTTIEMMEVPVMKPSCAMMELSCGSGGCGVPAGGLWAGSNICSFSGVSLCI